MSTSSTSVRVRFAPSPTGHLHIGGLRTALFNWLFARRMNGVYVLRIEDTDIERSTTAYTDSIIESLTWCNILPDEPIMIQSERITEHRRIAEQLVAKNKAYYCFCTPAEIKERHATHHGQAVDYSKYDRLCRDKKHTEDDLKKPHAIRFKIPTHKGFVNFDDQIRGTISFEFDQLDDFVIVRSDGTPTYNFVVVVDDAYMRITHVIRGEDHISNTPKQILIYQALGYDVPIFAHLPMILGPTGERLSKRDGATSVIDYKQNGYLAEALCNYLVRLGWGHGDQEIFSRKEMIQYFSLEHINKKGAIFDLEKLKWVNSVYMRALTDDQLLQALSENVEPLFKEKTSTWDDMRRDMAVGLYKQRTHTLKELADELIGLYQGPSSYNVDDVTVWVSSKTLTILHDIRALLSQQQEWAAPLLNEKVKGYAQQHTIKLVDIAQPVRIALTGKSGGPGLFETLYVLGKDATLERLDRFITYLKK